jgi:hypothetical protein
MIAFWRRMSHYWGRKSCIQGFDADFLHHLYTTPTWYWMENRGGQACLEITREPAPIIEARYPLSRLQFLVFSATSRHIPDRYGRI